MNHLIQIIEKIQTPLNFEGHYFLGVELDRYAHVLIACLLSLIFFYFHKKKLGLVVVTSLIVLKEVVDLGVIFYYEPIRWIFWKDSLIDIVMGFLGLWIGLIIYKRILKNKKYNKI